MNAAAYPEVGRLEHCRAGESQAGARLGDWDISQCLSRTEEDMAENIRPWKWPHKDEKGRPWTGTGTNSTQGGSNL